VFKVISNTLENNPKKLFVIDGIGALVSAVMLGIVLVQLEQVFGIPAAALYILAAIPCLFALYDWYCFRSAQINLNKNLLIIAGLNVGYCILSIAITYLHKDSVTTLGWTYIFLEILIVLFIAGQEYKTAKRFK
jgi:uncharacterized oligopeptide transporter (OPT) family protein